MKTYFIRYDCIADVWVPVEADSPEDAVDQFLKGKAGTRRQVTLEPVTPNPFSVYDNNRKFLRAVEFSCEELRRQEKEDGREIIALPQPQFEDAGFLDERTGEGSFQIMNQAPGLERKKELGLLEKIWRTFRGK